MKGIFLKESLKLIINIILMVGGGYNDNWIHSGIERWTDHGPEEKKIYTIEDIGPAENYEDFSVNFKEMDL